MWFGYNCQIIFCHFFHKLAFLFCELKLFHDIFKDKRKVAGDINSLNLLVLIYSNCLKFQTVKPAKTALDRQTAQTQIRLQKQSDLVLPCLLF